MGNINYREGTRFKKWLLLPVEKMNLIVSILENDELEDYIVIGKLDKTSRQSFLKNCEKLSKQIYDISTSYENYFHTKKEMNEMILSFNNSSLQLTQEGFDLITGKAFFTEGEIERTIMLQIKTDENGEPFFGNRMMISNNAFKEGGLAPIQEYYDNYFLTFEEYKTLGLGNLEDYMEFYNERVLSYLHIDSKNQIPSAQSLVYQLGIAMEKMPVFKRQLNDNESLIDLREQKSK